MNIPEKIRQVLESQKLIPDRSNMVVGVSGGADSIALLRAFHLLEIPCTIAHLNHGLRGEESDADEAFVRELADELGFPMVGKRADVKTRANQSGLSIEMAAREARHNFFAEFRDSVIALAHHADDQVETFLLKLARGAGTEGLCGMPFSQHLEHLRIIRPMLEIPRAEIIQWLEESGFSWREDSSNTDEAFLRNRIRQSVLPMIEQELNPNFRTTVLRTMDILRAEDQYVDEASSFVKGTTKLEASSTLTLPLALRRRIARKWLFEQGAAEAGFEAVEQILKLIEDGKGTTIFELNANQRVVVEYGIPRFEDDLSQPEEVAWTISTQDGTGWKRDESAPGDSSAIASVNAEKAGGRNIGVRFVRPGDRMEPLGMEGSRKLQDIFTDLKIPRAERHRLPVVVCEDEIIWLPGFRIARDWAVSGPAENSVHIYLEQNRTK